MAHLNTSSRLCDLAYVDVRDAGQPDGEGGAGEVLEGEVEPLLVIGEVRLERLLHRRPHQVRHVARARQPQVAVRQPTHVADHVAAQRHDVLHHRRDVHPQAQLQPARRHRR